MWRVTSVNFKNASRMSGSGRLATGHKTTTTNTLILAVAPIDFPIRLRSPWWEPAAHASCRFSSHTHRGGEPLKQGARSHNTHTSRGRALLPFFAHPSVSSPRGARMPTDGRRGPSSARAGADPLLRAAWETQLWLATNVPAALVEYLCRCHEQHTIVRTLRPPAPSSAVGARWMNVSRAVRLHWTRAGVLGVVGVSARAKETLGPNFA